MFRTYYYIKCPLVARSSLSQFARLIQQQQQKKENKCTLIFFSLHSSTIEVLRDFVVEPDVCIL